MLNQVTLVGRLGADPEVKETTSGTHFCNLSLATNERYKQGEEYKEKTQWHNIVVFQPALVESLEKYAKKGTTLFVQGALEYREYEVEGQKRFRTEIVCAGYEGIIRIVKNDSKPTQSSTNASTANDSVDVPF